MSLFPPEKPSNSDWIHAHCDGGSRGNPGPSGYGALITNSHGEILAELSEFLGIRTNNFAEYSGLLACLAYALENKHPRLKVVSDSELMVKQIQGKYKVNSPDLKPLWQEARNRIARLEAFEISHALRHKNKQADALANQAMDRGTDRGMKRPSPTEKVQSLPLRPIPQSPTSVPHSSRSDEWDQPTTVSAPSHSKPRVPPFVVIPHPERREGGGICELPLLQSHPAATPYPTRSTAPPDPYAANRTPAASGTMHRGFTKRRRSPPPRRSHPPRRSLRQNHPRVDHCLGTSAAATFNRSSIFRRL